MLEPATQSRSFIFHCVNPAILTPFIITFTITGLCKETQDTLCYHNTFSVLLHSSRAYPCRLLNKLEIKAASTSSKTRLKPINIVDDRQLAWGVNYQVGREKSTFYFSVEMEHLPICVQFNLVNYFVSVRNFSLGSLA